MKLCISEGNQKLGKIPSISLPPVITCAEGAPCAVKCYANKGYLKPARKHWQRNLDAYKVNRHEYFRELREYLLLRTSAKIFRFHVGGDFPDPWYLKACCELAAEIPGITFLAFTKQFKFLLGPFPKNFTIIASAWPGTPMPRKIRKQFPIAWMQDGWETRVPKSAIQCSGACDSCGMCWQLPKLGRDVCFNLH